MNFFNNRSSERGNFLIIFNLKEKIWFPLLLDVLQLELNSNMNKTNHSIYKN